MNMERIFTEKEVHFLFNEETLPSAAMFVDITKHSCYALSDQDSTPVIRFQEKITSLPHRNMDSIPSCETKNSITNDILDSADESPRNFSQSSFVLEEAEIISGDSNKNRTDSESSVVLSPVSDVNVQSSDALPQLVAATHEVCDAGNSIDQIHGTCDVLSKKISFLQLVVDELKEKCQRQDAQGKLSCNNISELDNVLQKMMKAEKIRNKERIRIREGLLDEKRKNHIGIVEVKSGNNSADEKPVPLCVDSESVVNQRRTSKLSKKKKLWRKNFDPRNSISSVISCGTDLSASVEVDDGLRVSDSTETRKANTSVEKSRFGLDDVEGCSVNHSIPTSPPQDTDLLISSPTLDVHNKFFNRSLQKSYGYMHLQHGTQQFISANNCCTSHSCRSDNITNSTIVLPSGRGKAREVERTIYDSGYEKLGKILNQAQDKLKSFLDNATAEESIVLDDSLP